MRAAAAQLLPLMLSNRFLLTMAPRPLQKEFGKPHLQSGYFFFCLLPFPSFPSASTGPSRPSIPSLSWWPACRCTPDCHYPYCWDQRGCLHCPLAFFHQRCFFQLHTSPFAQFGLLPRLAAAKQEPVSLVSFLPTHAASLVTGSPQEVLWPKTG